MKILKTVEVVKINCHGGIVSLDKLGKILDILSKLNISRLRFGLRQNIFLEIPSDLIDLFEKEMKKSEVDYQFDLDAKPNIMSSFQAETIFNTNSWLTGQTFKNALNQLDFSPSLKINITDNIQPLTPLFTGNINWVASEKNVNFWHLFIRFPKSNTILKWKDLINSNQLISFSKKIESLLLKYKGDHDYPEDIEQKLVSEFNDGEFATLIDDEELAFPEYNLPYYEGLNKYGEFYWMGIYRRNEWFEIEFLQDLYNLCKETDIDEDICITPWKSLIVKRIAEVDIPKWIHILNFHHINVRHALNELNFQVEDNVHSSVKLKRFIVKHLDLEDIRTSGIVFGIKSKPKTEVFSNILIRKRHQFRIGRFGLLPVYDIMLSKDFNPHERTGLEYRKSLPKYLLPDELNRCIISYYRNSLKMNAPNNEEPIMQSIAYESESNIYQCQVCKTRFEELNDMFSDALICPTCGATGSSIKKEESEEAEDKISL